MARWAFAILIALLGSGLTRAQFPVFTNPYFGISRGGISYTRVRSNSFFSFSLGRVQYRSGYCPAPFYAPTYRSVTVIYNPPPLYVAPRPALIRDNLALDVLPRGFLEGRPDPRQLVPQPKQPQRPPKKVAPVKPKPQPMPRPPMPQAPVRDPRAEYRRLLEAGKKAFANQQYGRAVERFGKATDVLPGTGEPFFYLTQSFFAQGKYFDAVEALRTGLQFAPDWPRTHFRPQTLYGPSVAKYADHLRRLKNAFERRPNLPELKVLQAYQLWIDGKRPEAVQLFEQLRKGPDRNLAEMFLQALPGVPV